MKVQCPAKVNLFLEVTGKRPDGYHNLTTLFAKINLYDVLDFEADMTGKIQLTVEGSDLPPDENNLVYRAAGAFFKRYRVGQGVKINLTKRIPMGAGLGGGSSDAAGTLLGLAKLFDIKAKMADLHKLGAKLGADVPFFLRPEPFCIGKGIGDKLRPLKIAKSLPFMILVYPEVHISTPESYKNLPKRRRKDVLTRLAQLDRLVRSLQRGRPVEEWGGLLFNRLEEAQVPAMAQVEQARRILVQLGAQGVRMSGSGSSVFGFVGSHSEAERSVKRLQAYPWKVFLTCCNG